MSCSAGDRLNVRALRQRLAMTAPTLADEFEELVLYDGIVEPLHKGGLVYRTAYMPRHVPPAQV